MSYYYESKADKQNYHYVNHKRNPFTAPHFHSAAELIFVRQGRLLAAVNGEEYTICAGEGCFVDKFCVHSYGELEADTETYAFVGNSEIFEPIFADLGGVPQTSFRFNDFVLLDKTVQYYESAKNESARTLVFKGAVSLLLSAIAESDPLCELGKRNSSGDICAILKYIGEHFREELTLEGLASEFGYSPQYFSRMFHKYMKMNLTEYINIARVNCAKKQLGGEKNVADIAFESGFGSMPSFYRAYKKVFGELPRG